MNQVERDKFHTFSCLANGLKEKEWELVGSVMPLLSQCSFTMGTVTIKVKEVVKYNYSDGKVPGMMSIPTTMMPSP